MALPPRGTASAPIRIVRTRSFRLPERGEAAAAIHAPKDTSASAPATPLVPKESDASISATVAAQAAVSRQGQQLTDPIDLFLASKGKKK